MTDAIVISEITGIRSILDRPEFRNSTIGLVPTMGSLHDAHISLIKKAREENDIVIVSIFVNPSQFAESEDYEQYPRGLEADLNKISQTDNMGDVIKTSCTRLVDIVFTPSADDMYPDNPRALKLPIEIRPQFLNAIEQGEHKIRPTFFTGVATVCCKLTNIIRPTNMYLGAKDAMQFSVVKRMLKELNMDLYTKLHAVPILRECDGLAMSSRNEYFSKFPTSVRTEACVLYNALRKAVRYFREREINGSIPVKTEEIRDVTRKVLESCSFVQRIQYIIVADLYTCNSVAEISTPEMFCLQIAVQYGFPDNNIRLIDNMCFSNHE